MKLIALLVCLAASTYGRLQTKTNSSLQAKSGKKHCKCDPPPLKCSQDVYDPCHQENADDSTFRATHEESNPGSADICDCDGDDEDFDLGAAPHIPRPNIGIPESFDPIQAWIDYYEEKDAADSVAAATRRAKSVTDSIRRQHRMEEMNLKDSNEMIRMNVMGGLQTILAKEQRRKQAERELQEETDKRNAAMRKASEEIQKVKRREEITRALMPNQGKSTDPLPVQANVIVEDAKGIAETQQNEKAFSWLADMVKKAVTEEVKKSA